jgi:arylsulfatase A-like enzyme
VNESSKNSRKLSRKQFLKRSGVVATGAGILGTGLLGILGSGKAPGFIYRLGYRPNVVWITWDAMRFDRAGFNGYRACSKKGLITLTPYLDKIAEQGNVFNNNICQSNLTNASVASFLSGAFTKEPSARRLEDPPEKGFLSLPSRIGMKVYNVTKSRRIYNLTEEAQNNLRLLANTYRDRTYEDNWTIAEVLSRSGYQTLAKVSTLLLNYPVHSYARGFQVYINSTHFKESGVSSLKSCLNLIRQHVKKNIPFFLWYHIYDPHTSLDAPEEFKRRIFTPRDKEHSRRLGIPIDWIPRSDNYDAQISFADNNTGILMEALQKEGYFAFDRDLFVFHADHGEDLGEDGHGFFHIGMYSKTTKVPLLIAGAGLPKGNTIDALTMNLDIAPTIAEMAGLRSKSTLPTSWEGKSLISVVTGAEDKVHDIALTRSRFLGALSLRTVDRSYIYRRLKDEISAPSKIDGFYPSGTIEFMGDSEDFFLRWPISEEISRDKENILTRVGVLNFGPGMPTPLSACYLGEKHHSLSNLGTLKFGDDGFCYLILEGGCKVSFLEDEWNSRCARGIPFSWGVEMIRETNGGSETVFSKKGISFALAPTPDFCQLFDLENDPEERFNLINERAYYSEANIFRHMTEDFLKGKEIAFEPDLEEYDKDELKALKALGYL